MRKLCIDCKWVDIKEGHEFAKCNYPKRTIISKVTGKKQVKLQIWIYCDTLRGSRSNFIMCYITGTCGYQGRYFEPNETRKKT